LDGERHGNDALCACERIYCASVLQEELRPYFSLPKVIEGLFSLAKALFGVVIEPADGLAPVCNIFP
jgi:hypothetical protein